LDRQEQIVMLEQLRGPGAAFSFFQTADGAEIDLVVQRSAGALGYEFKSALSVSPKDASGLRAGLAAGVIRRGRVVHLAPRTFPLGAGFRRHDMPPSRECANAWRAARPRRRIRSAQVLQPIIPPTSRFSSLFRP
jgi:hypothetical protein